jgi:hypothetical protein
MYLGTPADFTIVVMLVVIGVVVWGLWDRIGQLQRDVDALKRKADVIDAEPRDPL